MSDMDNLNYQDQIRLSRDLARAKNQPDPSASSGQDASEPEDGDEEEEDDEALASELEEDEDQQAARLAMLRDQQRQRAELAAEAKKEAKKEAEEKAENLPAKAGSAALLKQAWLNLLTSYGLTLLYINLHAFMSVTIGRDVFCKLGSEWGKGLTGAAGGEMVKRNRRFIGLLEWMLLILLDILVLIVLLLIIGLFVAIIKYIMDNMSWYYKLLLKLGL